MISKRPLLLVCAATVCALAVLRTCAGSFNEAERNPARDRAQTFAELWNMIGAELMNDASENREKGTLQKVHAYAFRCVSFTVTIYHAEPYLASILEELGLVDSNFDATKEDHAAAEANGSYTYYYAL